MHAVAKKRSGKRMGKYIRGNVDEEVDLGTLAAKTLTGVSFDETVEERTLISSLVASWSMEDWTPTANAGPIMVGVAHNDYSNAEVESFIENTGSWKEGDLVQSREIGRRLIKIIGTFPGEGGEGAGSVQVLNEGKPIKTKLNWILTSGKTLRVWAYNLGTAAAATTDAQVHAQGHANLWPR